MTHFARLATSQDIQAELMADDIDIDFDKMSLWTREEAENFFVTGEEPKPPWQPEPYLMGELDKCNLGHLKEVLGQEKHGELGTIGGLVNLMRTDRPKFLPTLKDLGVAKLPDRQALRDHGFSDRDIWDIASVTAFFNMSNRVAAATDMRPNPEYHGMAR